MAETHEVSNQPVPQGDINLWAGDLPLREAVERCGGASHEQALSAFGGRLGLAEIREKGRLANRYPPELNAFDRGGRRIDEVCFHPSYHDLMELGVAAGYSAVGWECAGEGGHVAHAAMVYLMSQVEPGVCCPMTMTYAAVPALRADPALDLAWRPRLLSRAYDHSNQPAAQKTG
ncbi:MAG: DNA alkylation response protein, partial [Pseudomonadota bacterium]